MARKSKSKRMTKVRVKMGPGHYRIFYRFGPAKSGLIVSASSKAEAREIFENR